MNNGPLATLYLGWLRARLRSTIFWALGMAAIAVATAAFYPALKNFFADFQAQGSAGVSSLLGLTDGIDPSSPLGYIWSNLYSNTVPWILMALGIALGDMTVTIDGKTLTNPGLGLSNVAVGTFASFAVATAEAGIAFLVGAVTGSRGRAIGVATGIAVARYVFYTLANLTGVLKFLTWLSSWRWYLSSAMLINGLGWEVVLPFLLAAACGGVSWVAFERRDLQSA